MTDLTVQRTLVKSPPELWSELSEVEGLARHLGEFGEIRITRAAPETTVAWEGEHASGTVEIEAAGWGTKVTLTAAVAAPEPVAEEPEPVAGPDPVAAAEPVERPAPEPGGPQADPGRLSDELDRIADRAQESYWDELVHWGERDDDPPAPKPRRGRFARFFRRRPRREPIEEALAAERRGDADDANDAAETRNAAAEEPQPSAVEPEATVTAPEPAPARPAEPVATEPDATEPDATEPQTAQIAPDHARAVLEHALDNLGAAHHRPFSRG